MSARSALVRGASGVVVDQVPDQLRLADQIGPAGVDFSAWKEHPELTLDRPVEVVRSTGGTGIVGVSVPQDPGLEPPDRAGPGGL